MDKLTKDSPIGIFDSGIGGLTVANAVINQLPNERIIYFGDAVHLPYGDKSADAIRYYSIKIAHFLLKEGCKMIIVACNSASSAAYQDLLDFFEDRVLFLNVVDPLVEHVSDKSFDNVGIIATKATINSGVYQRKLQEIGGIKKVSALATPLLVPMIEEGFIHNNISNTVLSNYLESDNLQNIESLLLACTHYPLIKDEIREVLGDDVKVYDSTDVVAMKAEQMLDNNNLLSDKKAGKHHFYISDYTDNFAGTAKMFFGNDVKLEYKSLWHD